MYIYEGISRSRISGWRSVYIYVFFIEALPIYILSGIVKGNVFIYFQKNWLLFLKILI
jgi:hypothetical protein